MAEDTAQQEVSRGSEEFAAWRKQLAHRITGFGVFVLPASFVVTFPVLVDGGHLALMIIDVVIVLMAIYFYFWQSRHHALVLQLIVCGLAYTYLVAMGPTHARAAWLMFAAIIAALFSGQRAALLVTALNAIVLFAAYAWMGPESPGWEHEYEAGLRNWSMFVLNLSCITLGAALAASHLLTRLDSALQREQSAITMQRAEHEASLRAHEAARVESEKRGILELRLVEAQKLEALGRLAGGVTHDLNNMLIPIMTYADLLRQRVDGDEELSEYVDEISDAGTRSRELIRQILTFSRGDEPGSEIVDVLPVIRSLLDQLRPTLPAGIEVHANSETELCAVRANEVPIYQICLNLVTNAIAAMPEGGALTITLRGIASGQDPDDASANLDSAESWVAIEVRDTGIGMDAATAARVFEPFFTTKADAGGSGIGLATLHEIVSALGGTVTVETALGRGTCFRVYLPAADEHATAGRKEDEGPEGELLDGTVLLVDDNEMVRASIRRQLGQLGLHVREAGTAEAALASFQELRPDVLIVDFQMPGASGVELAEHVRASDCEIPVILATGYAEPETYRLASLAGIDSVIIKPFLGSELRNAIAPHLSKG